jgi:hypothetical protein
MAKFTTQQNNLQNTSPLMRAERASFEKITSFPNLYKAYIRAVNCMLKEKHCPWMTGN